MAAERLLALSRWCGGHDNASLALINLKAQPAEARGFDGGVQVWDPFAALTIAWLNSVAEVPLPQVASDTQVEGRSLQNEERLKDLTERKAPKRRARKTRKSDKPEIDDVQLEIQIEKSGGRNDDDDTSR